MVRRRNGELQAEVMKRDFQGMWDLSWALKGQGKWGIGIGLAERCQKGAPGAQVRIRK